MRCRLSNREVTFIRTQSTAAIAVAGALRVGILLFPGAVRHRVPDRPICCWSIESDPSVFVLFIQTRFTFDVPLGSNAVSHSRSRFAYTLGNYGHALSQGRRQPAATKPPLCIYICASCSEFIREKFSFLGLLFFAPSAVVK